MSRPKQIAAVALSVAGLAALAACGGNDGSSGLTSTSSTATSSSPSTTGSAAPTSSSTTDKTSTPTATGARANIPEAAMKKTNAGAKAFMTYYHRQLEKAYLEGDPAPLEDLGAKSCNFCNHVVGEADSMKARGTHYEGTFLQTTIQGTAPGKFDGEITVVTRFLEGPSKEVFHTGRKYKDQPGNPALRVFETVRWSADGWRLVEVSKA